MSDIIYDCRWSDRIDDKFIKDFITTVNAVFKCDFTEAMFKQKYIDNIYGKSVVVVVYLDGQPVAARGLWRNDIDGRPSYQLGDTCVTEICRGKGIFTEMTKRSVDMLSPYDLIYNFPNQNSYPGYMKMGWKLVNEYGFAIFTDTQSYFKEHPTKMDTTYADWWLENKEGFLHIKRNNEYFLVEPMRKFCYKIVACVEKKVAERYSKAPFGIYFYRSTKKTFYNKKIGMPLHVVSKSEIDYIPLWKIDAI